MLKGLLSLPLDLAKTLGVVVWSVVWIVAALMVRVLSGGTRLPLAMARTPWASGILAMTGFQLDIEGAEIIDWSRPYFIAANHQSFLDIPVLFVAVPSGLHFVVKSELKRVPFLSWYIAAMGMIFVNRKNPEQARDSVRRTAEAARSGKTILLFPEGTRSLDGNIGRLKSGMLAAAAESSVPILPVAIAGTGEGMAKAWFPRYRSRRIKVRFGQPMSTQGLRAEDRRELASRLRNELKSLHSSLVQGTGNSEPVSPLGAQAQSEEGELHVQQ